MTRRHALLAVGLIAALGALGVWGGGHLAVRVLRHVPGFEHSGRLKGPPRTRAPVGAKPSQYIIDMAERMRTVPLGQDGGPSRSCDTELSAHVGKDAASVGQALPWDCQAEFLSSSRLRAYPERLAAAPGDRLRIFLALRPDQAPQALTQLRVRTAGSDLDSAQNLPVTAMLIAPKPCRSFWGTGCAFDQFIELPTTGLQPGGYVLEIKTTSSATEVPFIVRTLDKRKIRIVVPDWTVNAYSMTAGGSLYWMTDADHGHRKTQPEPRLLRVSTQRYPTSLGEYHDLDYILRAAAKLSSPFQDVGFLTNGDVHDATNLRDLADVIILLGHDEYWSHEINNNLNSFLRNGGRIANFSGNTNYWIVNPAGSELAVVKANYRQLPLSDALASTGHARTLLSRKNIEQTAASFDYGGYDSKTGAARSAGAWKPVPEDFGITLRCNHPLMVQNSAKIGDIVGAHSQLIYKEIDGLPLAGDGKSIVPVPGFPAGSRVRSLGDGIVVPSYYYTEKLRTKHRVSTFVEHVRRDGGRIIAIPSIGTLRALMSNDRPAQTLLHSVVRYLADGQFNDNDLNDCPWTELGQQPLNAKPAIEGVEAETDPED